jgi:hypothetical protein
MFCNPLWSNTQLEQATDDTLTSFTTHIMLISTAVQRGPESIILASSETWLVQAGSRKNFLVKCKKVFFDCQRIW